jgi:hypothetical protein
MTLSHYTSRYPTVGLSRDKYLFVQVTTRTYPVMVMLYDLFYTKVNGVSVKRLQPELFLYLNEIALAY